MDDLTSGSQNFSKESQLYQVRPLIPLTFEERWRFFIAEPIVKVTAASILVALLVGYFFATNDGSKPISPSVGATVTTYHVSTSTTAKAKFVKVYVTGAVKNSGVIELESTARIADAIALAGGANENADLVNCNLAAYISDGATISVPEKTNSVSNTACGNSGALAASSPGSSGIPGVQGKININTATQTEIETLPGIGPTMGAAIVAYRTQNGSFASVNDLRKVKGIGDKRFADLKDLVTV